MFIFIRMNIIVLYIFSCFKHATSHTAAEPTFHSAINHGLLYDRPRHRPTRRDDVPHKAIEPTAPSRYVDYGAEGHPYEQVARLREGKNTGRSMQQQGAREEDAGDDRDILRILQSGRQNGKLYQPLRIHFDTTDLERWSFRSTGTAQRVNYLKSYVLPRMARTWSSALSVVPVIGTLKISYEMCQFGDPASSPSLQPEGVGNTDLVIYVTANSQFCSQNDNKVLASAFSCFWDQFERPIAGTIDFCLDVIELEDDHPVVIGMNNENGQLSSSGSAALSPEADKALQLAVGTAVHEIAHVLGITSADMLFFYDYKTGLPRTPRPREEEVTCMTGERSRMLVPDDTTLREKFNSRGVRYFEVTLPTVVQVARNQFNCQRLSGVPLENQPTNEDCYGSHFEERYFFTEALSAISGGVPELLSSLTLGLLNDSGWYKPDFTVATVSPFGHGAGCEFVDEPCVVEGNIPKYSAGAFCNAEYKVVNVIFQGEFGCDPTHTSMGICDLVDYSTLSSVYQSPPKEFQYFPGMPTRGALTDRVDYCPTYSMNTATCQEVPARLEKLLLPPLGYFATAAESSDKDSRCFNTDKDRPICLEATCDESNYVLNVKVAGRDLVCSMAGQKHLVPETDVTFECPDIKHICPNMACPSNCAGNGICDFSLTNPGCECFDETDSTAGCTGSFNNMPPGAGWNDNRAGSDSNSPIKISNCVAVLLHFLLTLTWWIP